MTITLTNAQYEEQFEADEIKGLAQEVCEVFDGEETCHYYNAYTRNGCDRLIDLRPGLQLRIWSFESLQDLIIIDDRDWQENLSLSFFIRGDMHAHLRDVTQQVSEIAGNSYLMYCPGVIETEGWKANQKILRVKIIIEPAKFFHNLSVEQFDCLPQQLQQFGTQDRITPFYLQTAIASEIYPILQQILNCRDRGVMKQWYLEAKALELMTLQFRQLRESSNHSTKPDRGLDIDRIYQAKEILLQNWLNPPSVLELADRVGIYHMRLKGGFKEVFGTTPFKYLKEFRLEKAKEMLQDNQLTIVAVANAVGYGNPGHFAAAFKRKYGMTPREYRFKQ